MLPFKNRISKKQLVILTGDIVILAAIPFLLACIYCSIDLGTAIKIVYLKLEKLPFHRFPADFRSESLLQQVCFKK